MGGMAIQAFVIRHPDIALARVSGLVLLSTAARSVTSDARRLRGPLERVTGAVPNVGAIMRQQNLGLLIARMGFGDSPHPSHVEATRQMLAACSRETLRDASRAMLSLDLTPGLPSITLPDPRDRRHRRCAHAAARDSRQIASLIPEANLVEFPGAGHMLMYERAAEVDQLILDFARDRAREAAMRSGRAAAQ